MDPESNPMINPPSSKPREKRKIKIKPIHVIWGVIATVVAITVAASVVVSTRKKIETINVPGKTKVNQTGDIEFSELENVFKIPYTSEKFTIDVAVNLKNLTSVWIHGKLNDGRVPYGNVVTCDNQSCSISIKVNENLVSGENMTLILEPKHLINSLKGILHFSQIEKTPKPSNQTMSFKFTDFRNAFMTPFPSEKFKIDINVTLENPTLIHMSGTINGQRPYECWQSCDQKSCSIICPIDEKLVSGDNVTVIVKPEDKINSLCGFIRFIRFI